MNRIGTLFGLFALVVMASLGITFWTAMNKKLEREAILNETVDIKRTGELIGSGRTDEALELIGRYRSSENQKWHLLYLKALNHDHKVDELVSLYRSNPEIFKHNEQASLILANTFLLSNNKNDFVALRNKMEEHQEAPWILLDADYLILEGKKNEAIKLLQSKTFKGKDETNRLVKLALLRVDDKPKEAWEYLKEAYIKDPNDADIRSYRARLLENAGKYDQALIEYQAAASVPNNPFLKEQLADFYIRQKQYALALNILKDVKQKLDPILLKTYFWNRVVQPVSINLEGSSNPLLSYYAHLHGFWDQPAFEALGDNNYLKTEQSTFWLRILQHLKDKNEDEAYQLLKRHPFTTSSWNPDLEKELTTLLEYRKNGGDTLKNFTHEQLIGPDAFTAVLLKAGWPEAAIQLRGEGPLQAPEPVAINLVQAYMKRKDYVRAKELLDQYPTLAASLPGQETLAWIAVTQNDMAKAAEIYQRIEKASPVARSYLAKKAYEEKNWQKARELTELLIIDYPDNAQLKENLKKIPK